MTDTAVATTPRREATRERLLDAAAQVFAEVGLDAASVEAVCERAGFTRGAFYSNFDSKDEMFLQLAGRVGTERIAAVQRRVTELEAEGSLRITPADASSLIQRILDVSSADRMSVLLLSEIRLHSMRDPKLGAAYLELDATMHASVAQIIADLARSGALRLRVPADEAARLMLTVWEGESVRSAIMGLDDDTMCRRTGEELARVAEQLIEPPA